MPKSPPARHRAVPPSGQHGRAESPRGQVEPAAQALHRRLLLEAVATGDRGAFAQLYDDLAPVVLAVVRSLAADASTVEPTVVEVFCDLWRRAPVVAGRGTDVRTWALHLAVRHARERR